MSGFPALDPIPLPAPVWLLKSLGILTLSLHFVAVQLLVGGLLAALALTLLGRGNEARTAAAAMARRLPVVMTYVINLGVPPLLFAQVLYGRALYTSSVLMGAWWLSVIALLMACYWLLYRFSRRLEAGRLAWPAGLTALALAAVIARIYSSNMTLMLRPEAWQAMYAGSALGGALPEGDPTLGPRWIFMLCGAILTAGLWMLYLAGRSTFLPNEKRFLAALGGKLAAFASVAVFLAARSAVARQPEGVLSGLRSHALYEISAAVWLAAIVLAAALGLWASLWLRASPVVSWGAPVVAVLASTGMTIYRDGIRDLTLLSKGFDVWQRSVATNWGVVGLFVFLLLAGLAAIGWMVSVVARAAKLKESVA